MPPLAEPLSSGLRRAKGAWTRRSVSRVLSRAVSPRPLDGHSSRPVVTDGLRQPTRTLRAGNPQARPCLALLPAGFTSAPRLPGPPVRSYRTVSPSPMFPRHSRSRREAGRQVRVGRNRPGRLFSVALSVGSRRPGVTRHRALRSSDFPLVADKPPPATIWISVPGGRDGARENRRNLGGPCFSGPCVRGGQPDRHGRPDPLLTVDGHATAVPLDDSADDRQAQSCPPSGPGS